MLPWLQKKSQGSISGTVEDGKMKDDQGSPMHAAAQDLLSAIEAKDIAGIASALQAAYELGEMPEEEGQA